ncbi:MAG: hypothetical protein H6Q90_6629, partial [Deltaproteobacteria bacterium]|nr:hypothetical protein [Deltaproteobacteria bacterium]
MASEPAGRRAPSAPPPDREPIGDRVRRIAASPGVQLVVCGVLLAFAFPARSSGAIGLSIIGGALGVGVARLWPHAPAFLRSPPGDVTSALV